MFSGRAGRDKNGNENDFDTVAFETRTWSRGRDAKDRDKPKMMDWVPKEIRERTGARARLDATAMCHVGHTRDSLSDFS